MRKRVCWRKASSSASGARPTAWARCSSSTCRATRRWQTSSAPCRSIPISTPLIAHPNFPQFARGATFHEKPDSKPKPDSNLFLLDVRIEYLRAGDKMNDWVKAEWRVSEEMIEKRQLVGIWRRANALGTFVLWNLPTPEAVGNQLRAMPLYPTFTDVTVTPLVMHPNFPQFARPAEHHEKPAQS
jgi:muconolactone delta-isomerase